MEPRPNPETECNPPCSLADLITGMAVESVEVTKDSRGSEWTDIRFVNGAIISVLVGSMVVVYPDRKN